MPLPRPLYILMLWLSLGCKSAFSSSYAPAEPVIGILTYPSDDPNLTACDRTRRACALSLWAKQTGHNGSYVDSAYVRWLEMAGARVVAIPYDATDAEVRRVFARVNGVLFTGGPAKPLEAPPPYFETASLLYELVEEAWSRGETVPLWGTCLGLQAIACIAAEGTDVLGDFPLEDFAYPLVFTAAAAESRLFGHLTSTARKDFAANVTTNWHHYGVAPASLPRSLQVLAVNRALNGKMFVSALEGRDGLPVFAVQFHPESVQFMPQVRGVPAKSAAAIRTAQYLGNFFVNAARGNSHSYDSAWEEAQSLISQVAALHLTPGDRSAGNAALYPEGAYVLPAAASSTIRSSEM